MKIHTLNHNGKNYRYWFDRAYRCWFATQLLDEEGNESPSVDSDTRFGIIDLIKRGYADG